MPDNDRQSWRPQDENGAHHRRKKYEARERDYGDEERYASRERERMGSPWDDRSGRSDDREDRHRSTEYGGQGQSGYGAGRHEGDRAFHQRNETYPSDEEDHDRGTDDRFTGRGGYGGETDYRGGYGRPGRGLGHRGKGPRGYTRSDERIREIACELLTESDDVDATHIEVSVRDGEVTLKGTVDDRRQKRAAEDVIETIAGVKDVQNQLRVGERSSSS